ncbi:MAG: hypothetical protein IPH75_10840 [bacterium]|nr:hypothetical protein [bacterium]
MSQIETRHLPPSDHASFLAQADLELKRAERYRIFVSLIVLDLTVVRKHMSTGADEVVKSIMDAANARIRCTDTVTLLDDSHVALLFPETPRQNAMIAGRRIADMVRRTLSERLGQNVEDAVPMETASYPDAAGAKSVKLFLEELAKNSRN